MHTQIRPQTVMALNLSNLGVSDIWVRRFCFSQDQKFVVSGESSMALCDCRRSALVAFWQESRSKFESRTGSSYSSPSERRLAKKPHCFQSHIFIPRHHSGFAACVGCRANTNPPVPCRHAVGARSPSPRRRGVHSHPVPNVEVPDGGSAHLRLPLHRGAAPRPER